MKIDLNSDMGEGCSNDAELMRFVSSVNIACGFHAGDVETMRRTVDAAIENGCTIGAHPGYADRENFGRTEMNLAAEQIRNLISEQLGILNEICVTAGARLCHVKPHGALYNQSARNPAMAAAVAEAVRDFDNSLILFGLSGSFLITEAERVGLRTASEVFADRTYKQDGSLTPRGEPDALIKNANEVLAQLLSMVDQGVVTGTDGTRITIRADTVCIHGDGENALSFAGIIHRELIEKRVEIRAVHG